MKPYLLSAHMLGALSILFVIGMVAIIPVLRYFLAKPQLPKDMYGRLALDLTTLIPVAALLWNLLIYCISNTPLVGLIAKGNDPSPITFAAAVEGSGELAVIIAVLVVLFKLCAGIWHDMMH